MKDEPSFIVIVVDAIIGSGKTTLIEKCLLPVLTERGLRITYVKEPINHKRLEDFYQNKRRRAFQFQTRMFHDRVKECQNQYQRYGKCTDVFLLERSVFSDVMFMQTLHDEGNLDDTEYEDYMDLWKMWEEVMPFKPDLFIYLKPDLDVSMNRVRERSRTGEEIVDQGYQALLQEKHDALLGGEYVSISDSHFVPCIHLNTNSNFRDDENVKKEIADDIEKHIHRIKNRNR